MRRKLLNHATYNNDCITDIFKVIANFLQPTRTLRKVVTLSSSLLAHQAFRSALRFISDCVGQNFASLFS